MQLLLTAVFALLLVNLVVALVVVSSRPVPGRWLLFILLSGTTGAALVAVLALLVDTGSSRFVDVALVLTGLALVSTAIRATAPRRPATGGLPAEDPGRP